ncbi:uncharacterized protein METZ01_LOCUS475058, partial [marine metagenome]
MTYFKKATPLKTNLNHGQPGLCQQ